MLFRSFTVLSTTMVVAGCVGIAPADLTMVDSGHTVEVTKEIVYESGTGGLLGGRVENHLMPGIYRAKFADKHGVYYEGAPLCWRQKLLTAGPYKAELVGRYVATDNCGLYVPNDTNKPAAVYVVNLSGHHAILGAKADVIEAAINNAANPEGTAAPRQTRVVDSGVVSQAVANSTAPSLQAGAGAGIGVGLATSFANAEIGRYYIFEAGRQPEPAKLKDLIFHRPPVQ